MHAGCGLPSIVRGRTPISVRAFDKEFESTEPLSKTIAAEKKIHRHFSSVSTFKRVHSLLLDSGKIIHSVARKKTIANQQFFI